MRADGKRRVPMLLEYHATPAVLTGDVHDGSPEGRARVDSAARM